jgi:stage II sporulation protein P
MKCLWVITAVFLVPLGIFTYSGNIDRFSSAATLSADLFTGKSATEATAYSDEPTLPAGREISHSEIPDMDMAPDEIEREVESSEIPSPLTVVDVSDKLPYPDNLTSHDGVIQKFTYGYYDDDS